MLANHRYSRMCREAENLYDKARYREALQMYGDLRKFRQRTGGPSSTMYLSHLHSQIYCLCRLSRWKDAAVLAKELSSVRDLNLGTDNESSIDALVWYAWVLVGAGDERAASIKYFDLAERLDRIGDTETAAKMQITARYFQSGRLVTINKSSIRLDLPHGYNTRDKGVAHLIPQVNDVFLSHASEDKPDIAIPLKAALESRGISVWFDTVQISLGQSISDRIASGIRESRFGVVVLSPDFIDKAWTREELRALYSIMLQSSGDTLLPIWHNLGIDDVRQHFPLLADRRAASTSVYNVDEIAELISGVLQDPSRQSP